MDTPNTPYSQDNSDNSQYPRYPRYDRYRDRYDDRYGRRRSRWWIPFVVFLVIVFGFFALFAGALVSLTGLFEKKSVTVKSNTVLQLRIAGALQERSSEDLLSFLDNSSVSPSFFDVLSGIRRAKNDENIVGIYIDGGLRAGSAKMAELREALIDFKQSGKFVYAYIEFGSERDYYLASVADSVFMPVEGLLEMNGFSVVSAFFKGTLDKIGVDYHIEQFEEYKSAVEPYSRTKFSEPAKQELRELLDARSEDFVRIVSSARSMSPEIVKSVLDRGVYTADSLLALGFIDGIRSKTSLKEAMALRVENTSRNREEKNADKNEPAGTGKSDTDTKAEKQAEQKEQSNADDGQESEKKSSEKSKPDALRLIGIAKYLDSDSGESGEYDDDEGKVVKDKQVAVIFASGTIVSNGDEESQIVSGAFIRNLKKARENKKVKAIVVRIDSPGGSSFASDEMWEEIRKTAKEKPVYASMSDVAASGGYYMAMACDTIIAHPNTITGSIGVLLLLPNATKLMENIGVSVDTVMSSPAAIGYDPSVPISDANKERIHRESEKIYRRFVGRVAESRKRPFEDIRSVAKGRVWTGKAALSHGLVDTLGGLQTAIAIAKRRIGVPEGGKVEIRRYPSGESNRFERIMKRILNDDEDEAALGLTDNLQKRIDTRMLEKNAFWKALPENIRTSVAYLLELGTIAERERTLMALPSVPEIR